MKYNFVDLATFMGGAYAAAAPAFATRRPTKEEASALFPGGVLPEETHVFWELESASAGSDHVILIDERMRDTSLLPFIVAHEKGHIECGHLDSAPAEDEIVVLENGTRVMNSSRWEVEADTYAFRELGIAAPERRVALLMAVFRQAFISQGVPPEKVASNSNRELEEMLAEADPVLAVRISAARNMVW